MINKNLADEILIGRYFYLTICYLWYIFIQSYLGLGATVNIETKNLLNEINLSVIKLRGSYSVWCKNHGVNYHEMLVWYSLYYNEHCTQKIVCDNYLLPKQTVHNIICRLKKDGYIELKSGAAKEKEIAMTESGKAYADSIMLPLMQFENNCVNEMGADNLKTMVVLLNDYGKALGKQLKK